MTTYEPRTAWDLIGWDDGDIRIAGGRATYEAVSFYDNTPGGRVKLSRLDVGATAADGIRQVDRYVDPDTLIEPADELARENWNRPEEE